MSAVPGTATLNVASSFTAVGVRWTDRLAPNALADISPVAQTRTTKIRTPRI
jgi:hypothetical protein